MLLIFVPKVIEVINNPTDKFENKSNTDTGVSKEDEERYQKLVSENDELQRLIALVSGARYLSSRFTFFKYIFKFVMLLRRRTRSGF